jgi:riboflavin kinase/FMN adenylyltransferase
MPLAARLLGAPYTLTGRVTHGRQLGHRLGFPTANMDLPTGLCIPRNGVYAARVGVGESSYPAVANIGVRPTVTADGTVNCESHLIGFSGDLYGKEIRVSLIAFLREEKQFASQNELRLQIDCDRKEAEKWLNSVGHS